MNSEDVYNYFMLQANLWNAAMSWIRNKVKDTEYQSIPYRINKVCLVDGGCISLSITFLIEDTEVDETYRLSVKELENV